MKIWMLSRLLCSCQRSLVLALEKMFLFVCFRFDSSVGNMQAMHLHYMEFMEKEISGWQSVARIPSLTAAPEKIDFNLPANAGVIRVEDLIPGKGRSLREGSGNPLQYSCLENPMEKEPGRVQSRGLQKIRHDWSDLAHMHTVRCMYRLYPA